MEQIKILHMADIHFGRPTTGIPAALRDIRRQEVRSAFSDAIALADREGVDVVLIAGDLFDTSETDKNTLNFVKSEIGKIPHIPVMISPGNHDPLGNAYALLNDGELENLTIFGKDCSVKTFSDKNFAVYGIGFDNETQRTPLLQSIKAQDNGMINIALIHGEISSESDYNPITESQIAETGMDYIALGHVHTYSGIKKSGKTHYAYCGILEGGGFDECDEKGVIFGTVSKDGCNLGLRPLSKRCYRTVEIDVTGTNTLQDVVELVKEKTTDKKDLYKIVITGQRPEKIPAEVIESEIGAFFLKVKDMTRGAYDLKAISADYTIDGIFAGKILERMEKADDNEKADLARAADIVMEILNKD